MLSAYSTLGIVIAHYLVNHENIQNPVDKKFIMFVMSKTLIRHTTEHLNKWNKALETAVITFSDTQVVTGVAILLCGYIQIPLGISSYHWQVVVALAWFSALTHLLTLLSLREYFRTHFEMAVLRAILMGFVMVLLAAALGSTGFISQNRTTATPAICLFSSSRRNEVEIHALDALKPADALAPFNFPIIVLALTFLITNYIIKVMGLFTKAPETLREYFRANISKLLNNVLDFSAARRENSAYLTIRKAWSLLRTLVLLTYVLSRALYQIGSSMLWEVRTFEGNQS